jgi:hypothetical protein
MEQFSDFRTTKGARHANQQRQKDARDLQLLKANPTACSVQLTVSTIYRYRRWCARIFGPKPMRYPKERRHFVDSERSIIATTHARPTQNEAGRFDPQVSFLPTQMVVVCVSDQ